LPPHGVCEKLTLCPVE
ncbi:hypothetical protein KIPB_016239, partial [Kipferlia bialata]